MTTHRTPMSWSARLLVALVLLLLGAAATAWGLAHYPSAARIVGVNVAPINQAAPQAIAGKPVSSTAITTAPIADARATGLEARLARVEATTQTTAGSAGRADALLIAFAARRAVDRGVALGYLENLLVQRFGAKHQAAIATIITASRRPVRLQDLQSQYDGLGPMLRRGGSNESMWTSIGRELGSLVEVRRAERPSADLDARFRRAQQQLAMGRVDAALAETMRMPGAGGARDWIDKARRYTAVQRALDEVESAALLGGWRSD
ncbi:MAG: hypothetical protein ABIO29_03170 [Sphingomicrobium sp.]